MGSLDLTEDGSSDNLGGDSDSQLENSLGTSDSGSSGNRTSEPAKGRQDWSTGSADIHKPTLFDIGEEVEDKVSKREMQTVRG